MPFYNDLRPKRDFQARDFARVFPQMSEAEQLRTITGLRALKRQLTAQVNRRKTEENLLIASWNVQGFGSGQGRSGEALYYIAEVLNAFDLIAIQELRTELADLDRVMRILGPNWRYMLNDATLGDAGNDERSAYIYNTDRVRLSGMSGEVSPWPDFLEDWPGKVSALKRPAYMTGFVTAWKEFCLVNLHLHPGKDREYRPDGREHFVDADYRRGEIELLVAMINEMKGGLWSPNLVLVGDMNFAKEQDDATIDYLTSHGFVECAGLHGKTTNFTARASSAEAYDRLFFSDEDYFRIAKEGGIEQGDVFNPFESVFAEGDWLHYREEMRDYRLAGSAASRAKAPLMVADTAEGNTATHRYFRDTYRKRMLSDHLPIWVELSVDDADQFLERNFNQITAELG
ncbi:MAG: hypothetical protein AAGF13_00995 [Pseudomonadota bacterium]